MLERAAADRGEQRQRLCRRPGRRRRCRPSGSRPTLQVLERKRLGSPAGQPGARLPDQPRPLDRAPRPRCARPLHRCGCRRAHWPSVPRSNKQVAGVEVARHPPQRTSPVAQRPASGHTPGGPASPPSRFPGRVRRIRHPRPVDRRRGRDRDAGARQALRRARGAEGRQLRRPPGRAAGGDRSQRRRQDDAALDPRRDQAPGRRHRSAGRRARSAGSRSRRRSTAV